MVRVLSRDMFPQGVLYRAQIVPEQSLHSVDQVINVDVVESSSSSFGLRGFYSVKFEEHRNVDFREEYNVVPHSVPGVLYGAQIIPAQSLRSVDQVINVDVVESSSSSFGLRGFY
ncbi:unnamed protein product [Echinostoma caproni]|uniref:Peptidase_S24 domain-containing protein n=1 Tax=Echinostoma caproni TaxID=27848 RepID=A0A183A570_9TREM|nr:unnamed protein product [Echinostoma caproni]